MTAESPPGELRERRVPWLALGFLLPALVLLGALVVYPIAYTVVRSLYDQTGGSFVGADNYVRLFTDPSTLRAVENNVIWVVVAPAVVTFLGLVFAVLTERIRWGTAFKLLVFMPMAISFLAAGIIFRLVYDQDPAKGVANAILVSVRDAVGSSSQYPDARPRTSDQLRPRSGGFESVETYRPGSSVTIGLVGYPPQQLPGSAAQAARPAPAGAGAVTGTVWLDFRIGGGGKPDTIDSREKAMPGVTVQAVRDGTVVATTRTGDRGRFAFDGLGRDPVTLVLPASNFSQPFRGLTWLGPTLVTPAIIGSYLWIYAGFAMVLIAAGLAAIPRDALEAARVDGATEWQVFRRVTMPLLSPVLVVVFVTLVINVMKIFDLVFIIAPLSAQQSANVLALQMWRVSFGGAQDLGLGSAISVFLFLLVVPAMVFNVRRFRSEQR